MGLTMMTTFAEMLHLPPLLAIEGNFLVSFWKPILPLIPLVLWAMVISKIYDKHAVRFFLAREKWNVFHLCMGTIALIAAYAMPMTSPDGNPFAFLAGLGAMILVLAIDLGAYAFAVKGDDRVPAEFKIRIDILTKMRAAREEKKKVKQAGSSKLVIRFPDKTAVPVPDANTPEAALRSAAEDLYIKAVLVRASQVDVAPVGKDNIYGARMLVDGVGVAGDNMPMQDAIRIMDYWKSCAKLDVADRRRKLQNIITVEQSGIKHNVRVTSIGVQGGMRLSMLFDPDTAVKRAAKDLGLLDNQFETLRKIVDDAKRGTVLLAGPADGGRTTLFYAVAAMHDAYTLSVQTLELDQQLTLEGVRHQEFTPAAEGADFGTTVRSLLRRDPDVLAVSEMPDAATALEVAKSDADRTRTYLSIRSDSAMAAIEKYVQAVGDPKLAAKTLRGVVAGKLLRKLCTNCRVAYPPSPEMLKKLGVGDAKVPQLFKKGGQVLIKNKPEICPVCGGGGYIGQEGIFEVFVIGDEERELISQGNLAGVKASLRKQNLPSIQQAAIRKALAGTTSVEEVQRATTPPSAPPATPQPAAAPKA